MARLIDTSVFVELERRGQPSAMLRELAPGEYLALSSITATELLLGVERARVPARRRQRAAFVESVFRIVPVLPFDLRVARVHARIWAQMLASGQLVGANDVLIAATALAHDFSVLTENVRDFERVPSLVVQQPDW